MMEGVWAWLCPALRAGSHRPDIEYMDFGFDTSSRTSYCSGLVELAAVAVELPSSLRGVFIGNHTRLLPHWGGGAAREKDFHLSVYIVTVITAVARRSMPAPYCCVLSWEAWNVTWYVPGVIGAW